jgi:hypothetical protein
MCSCPASRANLSVTYAHLAAHPQQQVGRLTSRLPSFSDRIVMSWVTLTIALLLPRGPYSRWQVGSVIMRSLPVLRREVRIGSACRSSVTRTDARINRRVLPSVTDHGREDRGRVGNGSGNEPLGNQVRRLRQSRRRRCQAVVLFSADPSSRDSQTTLALLTTQGRTYESAAPRRSPWGQFVLAIACLTVPALGGSAGDQLCPLTVVTCRSVP